MRIYLLRHGETDWNKEGRLQGHKDIMMNSQGIRQMEKVGVYLHNNICEIDVIISSPLRRAKRSAEIVASQVGYYRQCIVTEPLFIERNFGIAEGLTLQEWSSLSEEECGMESLEKLCKRAKMGIDKYIGMDSDSIQNILVVSHGAILKALIVALTEGSIAYDDDSIEIKQGNILYLEYGKEKKIEIHQNLIKE